MREIAYHGTSSKHVDSIKNNGLDPKHSHNRADHWLGQGIYFFDDYDKALWWASCTSKNKKYYKAVFKAQITASDEEVLNLDDKCQLDKFIDYTIELSNHIGNECVEKMPVFNTDTARAVYFDYYKTQYNVSVIIRTFTKLYPRNTESRHHNKLRKQEEILKKLGLSFLERQICVSKKECIQAVMLVYKEDEEVI